MEVAGENATEANSNPGFFELNFSNPLLSNGNENDDEDAIFNFAMVGDAIRDEDYNLVLVANDRSRDIIGDSFSLPEDTTAARIEVRPVDDNDEEVDENVTFTLFEGEGYELGETSADILIIDSGRVDGGDVVGVQISESQGSTNLIEGQTTDNYTVELTSQPTSDVTITFNIVERNLNIDSILGKTTFLTEAEQRQQISNQYVFIDINDNGIQDSDEPSSLVDETGGDELDITPFDANENGILDVRVVVEGESPDFVFVDSNGNGQFDPDEPFSVVNPSGDNDLEIDFIDNNGNGVQDESESFLITSPLDPDGIEVAIAPFDLNENGVLEPGEDDNNNGILDPGEDDNENGVLELDELGQVVLESAPIDRWSFVDSNGNGEFDRGELFSPVFEDGSDLLDLFVEPGRVFIDGAEDPELAGGLQYLVTNPLATISRLLAEATDTSEAQDAVKTALGIPEEVDLLNFDALQAAADEDPNWLEVYAAQVQVQNTLVQIEAVTGVDETEIFEVISEEIVASDNDDFDLSDSTQVEAIIDEIAPELEDNTVDGAAEIITEGNERIDEIADDDTIDDRTKAIEIVQVQQVAQNDDPDGLVEDLVELGTESENVAAIVNEYTGEELTEQIEETEEIDPTIRPDFSNSRPIAEPDFATTNIDTPITIDVLANDSDPDNDAIEIVDLIATENTDADVDEDAVAITDIFGSDNGEVVINPDNTLTYTPSNGFTGEDIIFYAIEDSNGNVDSNIVTVTVTANEIVPNQSNLEILGTEQDDDIIGTSQGSVITGLGGSDRFIHNELGNTPDTITDFTPGEDRIVLTNLLDSIEFSGNDPIADEFVQFIASGSDTVLSIDSDGVGDLQPQPLLIVRDISIEDLSNANNFEF